MKLSRKAWNNVIIYASLFMILVLNLGNDKLFKEESEENTHISLVPEHDAIISLNLNGQLLIERKAASWVTTPVISLNKQQLAAMMDAWQQSIALPLAQAPEFGAQAGIKVEMQLAKQSRPISLTLYPTADGAYAHIHQDETWLGFAQATTEQLLPSAIWVSQ